MSAVQLAWGAVIGYVLLTVALTVWGALKTKDLSSYAVGSRDIPAALVGLSLTAQITSVATFVVNPGLIYAYGLAGLLGLGGAAFLGIILGLIIFSKRFRTMGSKVQALTIPQWIGARYGSPGLRWLFGILSLALLSFAVLIVVAIALVMSKLLKVPPQWLVFGVVIFVFAYVMVGGANTHAYTNSIQAIIMLVVALILIASGISLFWEQGGGILSRLAAIDPNLASAVNPASLYFRNVFEVFICNFLVGLAIVCQPHIMGKALYLKEDNQVKTYLTVAIAAGVVFVTVMVVGLYARIDFHPGISQLDDIHMLLTGSPMMRIDHVVPVYIATSFSDTVQVIIGIGVLCAGLSTLEGILLALSSIASIDFYLPLAQKQNKGKELSEGDKVIQQKRAIWAGRLMLLVVGTLCIAMSLWQIKNPTGGSVAIFAQYGVYLLFTASFFPLACGMFFPKATRLGVTLAVVFSIATYLGVSSFKFTAMSNNPSFLATCGIIVGWAIIAVDILRNRSNSAEKSSENPEAAV